MKTRKPLQKGEFNWFGEVHTIYRHASPNEAYLVLTRALSKKLGLVPYVVRGYFNGTRDNFKIYPTERSKTNESKAI